MYTSCILFSFSALKQTRIHQFNKFHFMISAAFQAWGDCSPPAGRRSRKPHSEASFNLFY